MAAAYLISQGMRPEDALAHLRQFRPFARPNRSQVRRLMRLADELRGQEEVKAP